MLCFYRLFGGFAAGEAGGDEAASGALGDDPALGDEVVVSGEHGVAVNPKLLSEATAAGDLIACFEAARFDGVGDASGDLKEEGLLGCRVKFESDVPHGAFLLLYQWSVCSLLTGSF